MNRKLVSTILIIVSMGAIACICMSPLVYFNRTDSKLFHDNHSVGKVSFVLDSDVDDIVMVKRIHSFIGSYYSDNLIEVPNHIFLISENELELCMTSANGDDMRKVIDSITKIPSVYKVVSKVMDFSQIYELFPHKETDTYVELNRIEYRSTVGNVNLIFDSETEKILWLNINSKDPAAFKDVDKELLEKNWIEYLNLDIINDWYYSNDRLVSDKAHLALECYINDGMLTLEFQVN